MNLPRIIASKKSGRERFTSSDKLLSLELSDFWSWAYSDILNNSTRGILAEFLVSSAINKNIEIRTEWDAFDITSDEGIKIEVKSCAYIQSWVQRGFSNIGFSIRPTKAWIEEKGEFEDEIKRQSDVYIFCLLKCQAQEEINPMNLDQWDFYTVSTKEIDEKCGEAKTLSFKKLLTLKHVKCGYSLLPETIKNHYANKTVGDNS